MSSANSASGNAASAAVCAAAGAGGANTPINVSCVEGHGENFPFSGREWGGG